MEQPRDGRGRAGVAPEDESDGEVSVLRDRNESRVIRDRYGVDDLQVKRDHAISQILAAISALEEVYFIGGTAINKTHVAPGRLSEGIDLIAVNDRATTVTPIKNLVEDAVQRSHGRVRWTTDFASSDVVPAVATTGDGTAVKIQLLSHDGYPAWPSEVRAIGHHCPSVAN